MRKPEAKKPAERKLTAEEKETQARAERDGEVRRVNQATNSNPPKELLSAGVYEVPKEALEAAGKLAVPDGQYRIIGSDYVHEFKGGKHVRSLRPRSDFDPKDVVDVA
jgi:hypothetical protein